MPLAWFLAIILAVSSANSLAALPDFTALVKESAPAVVNIGTTRKAKRSTSVLPPDIEIPENDMFGELLRRFLGEGGGEDLEFDSSSLGSGFVISEDGYVITNYHVVSEADEIVVKLSDRRQLLAKIVGTDPRSDIALLKVEADDLPVVDLGNSKNLEVGEWVLAIGSPFGFDHSVTAGIVSAKGRSLPSENYVPFIQTDVAINPGNSGGPLFNLDGKVVGINSQIYSRTGGFMGLSFAIPIEVALNVAEQLKAKGFVSRGWLGVYIQEVTRELAESFDMKKPSGALVARVIPDSPAEKAGLQVGDVILRFNDQEVTSSSALPPLVGATAVDETVPVQVLRQGRKQVVPVRLGELPRDEAEIMGKAPAAPKAPVEERVLGMLLENITAAVADENDLKVAAGVLVKEIKSGPAYQAGIRQGDVISLFNGKKVSSVSQLMDLVSGLPKGKPVPVLVIRNEDPIFLALKP